MIGTACDDGRIRIWNVQGDGIGGVLMESSNEPSRVLEVAHNTDRVTIVQYHPIAADVVASVSADYVIRVWNVQTAACLIQLEAHPDQVIFTFKTKNFKFFFLFLKFFLIFKKNFKILNCFFNFKF